MENLNVKLLAKERLARMLLEKYGPVLTTLEAAEVLDRPRSFLAKIPHSELPRRPGAGKGGHRYFINHIVNYMIPTEKDVLGEDFIFDELFKTYGAMIKTKELIIILKSSRLETYAILNDQLPVVQRTEKGTRRYMIHDVTRYITHMMFAVPSNAQPANAQQAEVSHV